MLLDVWDQVFLWIGKFSNKEEQKLSEELVLNYLQSDPAGRGDNTPIIKIKMGYEPPSFTGFFGYWDYNLWTVSGKCYIVATGSCLNLKQLSFVYISRIWVSPFYRMKEGIH